MEEKSDVTWKEFENISTAELEKLQKEENRKIAREGSWLNGLFSEHHLSLSDKQEVMRRVIKKVHDESVEKERKNATI